MADKPQKLKVFLCHASENKQIVQGLYDRLKADGFDPWLDSEFLLPGMNWDIEIQQAMRASDAVIVCFSEVSVTKEGYVQKEIKYAQEILKEKPEGTIFLLPVQLEACEIPFSLQSVQWGKYYETGEYEKIVKSLAIRAKQLNRNIDELEIKNLSKASEPITIKQFDLDRNEPKIANDKPSVQLIIGGPIESFDKRRREDVIGVLAQLLKVNESDIRILEVIQGSIILKIEIPKQSERKLKSLAENKDIRLIKLGIRSIQIGDAPPIQLTRTDRLPHGEFHNSTASSRKSGGNPSSTVMNPTRDFGSFARGWKEFWGRRKVVEPIPFSDTAIMTHPATFSVGIGGYYLQIPAMTAAIVTSSDGYMQVFTEGGYKELSNGVYTIQYIDLRDRLMTLSRIAAATKDGSEVSLTVSIGYKVNDPTQITRNTTPLLTFFSVCEAAVRNFIVTHRHDEIIAKPSNEQNISDREIIEHIKKLVAMNQACKAFSIIDVIIKERLENLRNNKSKDVTLQGILSELGNVLQHQETANERKMLETTKAEYALVIKEVQELAEANQSEILKRAQMLEVELETMRKIPEMQKAQVLRMIEVKSQALENLIQLFKISGFPRDTNDLRIMATIINALSESRIDTSELPPERSKSVNELSSTIINLITPKK